MKLWKLVLGDNPEEGLHAFQLLLHPLWSVQVWQGYLPLTLVLIPATLQLSDSREHCIWTTTATSGRSTSLAWAYHVSKAAERQGMYWYGIVHHVYCTRTAMCTHDAVTAAMSSAK